MVGNARSRALDMIASLAPRDGPVVWRTPIAEDEARWFVAAVEKGLVSFGTCPAGCERLARRKAGGPDEFLTPSGLRRHLFSKPDGPVSTLNREYVAHIAAFGYAVLARGYPAIGASFSDYRTFKRDAISRRAGSSYELDLEFVVSGIRLVLGEAKANPAQVARISAEIEHVAVLDGLPDKTIKEIEYVLDLAPRFVWILGPGTIDPPRHVFEVELPEGQIAFRRVFDLPSPYQRL